MRGRGPAGLRGARHAGAELGARFVAPSNGVGRLTKRHTSARVSQTEQAPAADRTVRSHRRTPTTSATKHADAHGKPPASDVPTIYTSTHWARTCEASVQDNVTSGILMCGSPHSEGLLTLLAALAGWKAIGAIVVLFGVIAPTVHVLFECIERQCRRQPDSHALVVRRSQVAPHRLITSNIITRALTTGLRRAAVWKPDTVCRRYEIPKVGSILDRRIVGLM